MARYTTSIDKLKGDQSAINNALSSKEAGTVVKFSEIADKIRSIVSGYTEPVEEELKGQVVALTGSSESQYIYNVRSCILNISCYTQKQINLRANMFKFSITGRGEFNYNQTFEYDSSSSSKDLIVYKTPDEGFKIEMENFTNNSFEIYPTLVPEKLEFSNNASVTFQVEVKDEYKSFSSISPWQIILGCYKS